MTIMAGKLTACAVMGFWFLVFSQRISDDDDDDNVVVVWSDSLGLVAAQKNVSSSQLLSCSFISQLLCLEPTHDRI
jgi:hypothetical protein